MLSQQIDWQFYRITAVHMYMNHDRLMEFVQKQTPPSVAHVD